MAPSENVKFINSFPNPNQGRFDRTQWVHDHGQSNVIINCHAKQIYYPDHWTPLSMKCCFNGKEYYQSGNAIQCTSDDSFLIFNEGKEYTSFINSDSEVESLTINFSEYYVAAVINSLALTPANNLNDPFPEKAVKNIHFFERSCPYNPKLRSQVSAIKELTKEFQKKQESISELLPELLESLVTYRKNITIETTGLRAAKQSTRLELYKRLHMAKDLLDSSYQTDLSLDMLSKVALLNPYYLLRIFKSYFKITPHQYLIKRRITEAGKYLKTGKYSVAEVCMLVGFSDLTSFSKLFKKETGMPPSVFAAHSIQHF